VYAGYEQLENGSLRIDSVSLRQSGIYVCVAQNSAGTAMAQVRLQVQGNVSQCATAAGCVLFSVPRVFMMFATVVNMFVINNYSCHHNKLSEYTDNDSGIMPSNSLGGSTLQWVAGRRLLCVTLTCYLIQ